MNCAVRSPRVSVVMATHNRAAVVGRAIESILHQSYDDFEFIIVDDGSSDETPEVLQSFAARDQRIVLHKQTNKGMASARNMGARQARGQYVAFMDDDDFSLPLRLERQVALLEQYPNYVACICPYDCVGKTGKYIEIQRHSAIQFIDVEKPFTQLHWNYYSLGPSTVLTKESFVACGGYRISELIIEDIDFTLRFQEKFRVALIEEPLYDYCIPQDNIGQSLSSRDPVHFMHRHVVSYISALYQHKAQIDPVKSGVSMDQILQGLPAFSGRLRYIIYRSLLYYTPILEGSMNCSKEEATDMISKLTCCNLFLVRVYDLAYQVVHYYNSFRRVFVHQIARLNRMIKSLTSYS